MTKTVTIIKEKKLEKRLKVAAYARVSVAKDSLLHSLNNQVDYYRDAIKKNKNYIFPGVYADYGFTGTKDNRPEFQKMLDECRKGNIDLIITKSISRFARNTASFLKVTRELKALNVNVFFEEQNMYSISEKGEFILTILASIADEEARSMSENVKWSVLQRFAKGEVYSMTILGYRIQDGTLVVEPKEAKLVKEIFDLYLKGMGILTITKYLRNKGTKSRYGRPFSYATIHGMLKNAVYTGDLILQKTYRKDHRCKHWTINRGERRMWLIENAHEPIIDKESFNKVQEMLFSKRISESYGDQHQSPFAGMVRCHICGHHYRRKKNTARYFMECTTFAMYGKDTCPSKAIPEEVLFSLTNEILGMQEFDEKVFHEKVVEILAEDNNTLIFKLTNGKEITKVWKDKSRRESWTPEKRAIAALRAKKQHEERRKANEENNSN